jgi:hypothetical protein
MAGTESVLITWQHGARRSRRTSRGNLRCRFFSRHREIDRFLGEMRPRVRKILLAPSGLLKLATENGSKVNLNPVLAPKMEKGICRVKPGFTPCASREMRRTPVHPPPPPPASDLQFTVSGRAATTPAYMAFSRPARDSRGAATPVSPVKRPSPFFETGGAP